MYTYKWFMITMCKSGYDISICIIGLKSYWFNRLAPPATREIYMSFTLFYIILVAILPKTSTP